MEPQKVLFCIVFIPLLSPEASDDCTTSYCDQSPTEVRFPFRLTGQQPVNCGYPGFDLRCSFPSTLLINIPGSGEFSVRSIDYHSQTIRLYDPLNCFPARFSTFDLSNSPFSASNYQNFTLLGCPRDANFSGGKPIDCVGNSSVLTLASDSDIFVTSMTGNQTGCVVTRHLRVPVDQRYGDGSTSQLDKDITLTWGTPNCGRCEAIGSTCGYAYSNTKKIACFSNLGGPKPSGIFRIIAFAMAIPAMAASILIACFMCTKDRRNQVVSNRRTTNTAVTPEDGIVLPNIIGLDQTTIESYTKVILGESKRLPGHHDATCPICLSEYNAKETVRCIPECRHCFHSECIDEWLKMNGTCPVCRNSPSPIHVES